jgi:hypothetical protein
VLNLLFSWFARPPFFQAPGLIKTVASNDGSMMDCKNDCVRTRYQENIWIDFVIASHEIEQRTNNERLRKQVRIHDRDDSRCRNIFKKIIIGGWVGVNEGTPITKGDPFTD